MGRVRILVCLCWLIFVGNVWGDESDDPVAAAATNSDPTDRRSVVVKPAAKPAGKPVEDSKLNSAVLEALERNNQEIKALRDRYAKDMEAQRKIVEAQQRKIETIEQSAQQLRDQLAKRSAAGDQAAGSATGVPIAPANQEADRQARLVDLKNKQLSVLDQQLKILAEQIEKQQAVVATAPAPSSAGSVAVGAEEIERRRKLDELKQKQMEVLEKQSQLLADQIEKQAGEVGKLQSQTATLESRAKQAALRDKELADAHDTLVDTVDNQRRNPPRPAAPLSEWATPSGNNSTPFSVWNTISTRYSLDTGRRGAGFFQFQEYSPFFLVQLNKRFLLSAETTFTPTGVSLGQAQIDMFITDWLTADIGYFLAPIGFWNERLDPEWINKLPDIPLVMRQVIPDGLTLPGLQFRGAKYLGKSRWKAEYSVYATNGLGVPGAGQATDWYNLAGLIGTSGSLNNAMAYGGRIGLWLPSRGINFGVSELVNVPYGKNDGALISDWQPYFNYHRGNWDARFEYGQNYERTQQFIGSNINRTGLYAQLAYRDYQSIHKHIQRLEYVFRYSEAAFQGIDLAKFDPTSFNPLTNAPVNRSQYTAGLNYYFYPSTILKFAYEINTERGLNLMDNLFMVQFATNF